MYHKDPSYTCRIISNFESHYKRLHLQNYEDIDERVDVNIYKADQIITLKWSTVAREEIYLQLMNTVSATLNYLSI